jgi:hypothetical protein
MRAGHMKLSLAFLLLAACSGSSAQGTLSTSSALSGPIDMRVADVDDDDLGVSPPAAQATHVVVTVTRIDARFEDARPDDDDAVWTTVSTSTTTLDLLSLQGGTFASFGVAQLPAGSLEALRLFISPAGPNYVTTGDGVQHTLSLPPGTDTWIKVVGDFDVAPCASGHVTLAFAGRKSLVLESDSGAWLLRPVIRIREVAATGACPASENGQGNDGEGKGHGDHGDGK